MWWASRISNPFFVQTVLKKTSMWRPRGQPCRSQAGTATATGTSWGPAPTWASLLAPRGEITVPSFAHHSGSSGDLTPEAETENILPADTEPPTAARAREESNISPPPLKNRKSGTPCALPRLSCPEGRNQLFPVRLCLLHNCKPWGGWVTAAEKGLIKMWVYF